MPSVLPCSSTPSHCERFHLPAAEVVVRLRDVASLREQQRERVLGRREDVRLRRVHHHHAAPRRFGDVDVVEADTGPSDDDEVAPGLEHLGASTWVALRMTSADAPASAPRKRFGAEAGLHVDVEAGRDHRFDAASGERFADEDARSHGRSRLPARDLRAGVRVGEHVPDAADAVAEIVVTEREGKPRVAGRAERLAGDDRDLGHVEQHLAELERVVRAPARDLAARARRGTTGSSRTRPAVRGS